MRNVEYLRSSGNIAPWEIYAELHREAENRFRLQVFHNESKTPAATIVKTSDAEARAWFDGYCLGRRAATLASQ